MLEDTGALIGPRTRLLLEGRIVSTLLHLAWPNILVMLAQASTGLIETIGMFFALSASTISPWSSVISRGTPLEISRPRREMRSPLPSAGMIAVDDGPRWMVFSPQQTIDGARRNLLELARHRIATAQLPEFPQAVELTSQHGHHPLSARLFENIPNLD